MKIVSLQMLLSDMTSLETRSRSIPETDFRMCKECNSGARCIDCALPHGGMQKHYSENDQWQVARKTTNNQKRSPDKPGKELAIREVRARREDVDTSHLSEDVTF
ncbi:hypothetical protein PUN4_550014 [Paraburkholderia unamae]|uniref:hypothetical protein n=1 Tax=Paraburkholderia unamae TaxID=219649 RepID=UPI001CACD215|nr:hypothetical protein [Paraburkholderia unamae]CAG9267702.1 hypothetical protein PUN4_550014 [Paraburkholderia unamae]